MPSYPIPKNEVVRGYAPGSPERAELKEAIARMGAQQADIPAVIGGVEMRGGETFEVRAPFEHRKVLATVHSTSREWAQMAIASALKVREQWAATPLAVRSAIFLRAAELLSTKYRAEINAATIWGQGKTASQAEVDAACESIDFVRFNVEFARQIEAIQPSSSEGVWNQTDYRPLDGFVFAIAPFNFTAIALNLAMAPALMGNVVLLKPSETATLSAWVIYRVFQEAGLPAGVLNFLPGSGATIGDVALKHPDLGGLHFTGSTTTFQALWKTVGDNIGSYRQYPRLVGETGGKDFILVHQSAAEDLDAVATAIVRAGFEYQGQKCSACSRVFAPKSLWPKLKARIIAMTESLPMGPPTDFRNFVSAVIDQRSFSRIGKYLDLARGANAKVLLGAKADAGTGWYVTPTLVEVDSARHPLMVEEIFGPVVTFLPYEDALFSEVLRDIDGATGYALTGSIFARDRQVITQAQAALRGAAGNFYINDKCTGAVVGQQPFGGSRASGTNDKGGSLLNLLRWTSPRTIKETFVPPTSPFYPSMAAE